MGPISKLKLPSIQTPTIDVEGLKKTLPGDGKISNLKEGMQKAAANFVEFQNATGNYITARADAGVQGAASAEQARLAVQVHARAGAEAHYSDAGQIAEGDWTLRTKTGFEAELAAVVKAGGSVGLRSPELSAGAEVFIGERAALEGGAAIDRGGKELGEVQGRGEAWAGIGAEGSVKIEQHDDTVHVEAGAGMAVGVGAAVGGGVTIDGGNVAGAVQDAANRK